MTNDSITVRNLVPSTVTDIAGAMDAEVLIPGDDAWLDVTLVPNQDGELDTWGDSPEMWCSDIDALPNDADACREMAESIVEAVRSAAEA